MDNAVKLDFGERNALETNLLVAMLVATVTFAAAFTMPGGYKSDGPDQGLANLVAKVAFKAFVIFDTTAFLFSVTAVGLQLDTSRNYKAQIRYMNVAALCTMHLHYRDGISICFWHACSASKIYWACYHRICNGWVPSAIIHSSWFS
jgi:hypothetical protein